MTRARFLGVAAAAALIGGLTACSSGTTNGGGFGQNLMGSTPAGGAAASSGSATGTSAASSAPGTVASSSAAPSAAGSPSSPAKSVTISAVLGKFSTGAITVNHMPSADPAWLARVQTEPSANDMEKITDHKLLNLMALVDEAAREKDLKSLKRLCSGCDNAKQLTLWQKPGALETLSTLLEKTHYSEGDLFPGFVLVGGDTFQDADSAADGKALGASSPNEYAAEHGGWATAFEDGTGGENPPPQQWYGLRQWVSAPS